MAEEKLPAELIKERIKNYAVQLEAARRDVERLRKEIEEKEKVGNQIVGGLKSLQELIKEFET